MSISDKVLSMKHRFCSICGKPRNTLREAAEHMNEYHPIEALRNFKKAMIEWEIERRKNTQAKWDARAKRRALKQ